MALSNEDSGRIYLGTFDGWFEVRLKESQPGCLSRVNKNGKTIFYKRYNAIEGMIRGISTKTVEGIPGEFFSILIQDDKLYQLDIPVSSSSSFYLIGALVQADMKKPVKIKVWANVEDDKKKTVFNVYQGADKPLKCLWTKENPGDCPPMVKVKFKGEERWDDTDRNEFVKEYIQKNVVPNIIAPVAVEATHEAVPDDAPEEEVEVPAWLKDSPPPPSEADEPAPKSKGKKGK